MQLLVMTRAARRRPIALQPRPWLTREAGECAFPIDGRGVAVRACCNPSGPGIYCPPHAAIMRGPAAPPTRDLEREILALLERGS
jgi:hypothetical protein